MCVRGIDNTSCAYVCMHGESSRGAGNTPVHVRWRAWETGSQDRRRVQVTWLCAALHRSAVCTRSRMPVNALARRTLPEPWTSLSAGCVCDGGLGPWDTCRRGGCHLPVRACEASTAFSLQSSQDCDTRKKLMLLCARAP